MKIESTMKLLIGSAVIYAVVAACGSGSGGFMGGGRDGGGHGDAVSPVPDAMADIQSGSRLKAQYFAGTDGSKTFASMYDSQLKATCAFVTASDGSSRCFPTGLTAAASTSYYSDSHCSQPILNIPSVCTAPPPYVTTFGTSCSGTTTFHIYPSGSMFTLGADVYVGGGSGATGSCIAVSAKDSTGTWYSVGAELPPSQFVEGTLQTD
jgi:hypothetical protein